MGFFECALLQDNRQDSVFILWFVCFKCLLPGIGVISAHRGAMDNLRPLMLQFLSAVEAQKMKMCASAVIIFWHPLGRLFVFNLIASPLRYCPHNGLIDGSAVKVAIYRFHSLTQFQFCKLFV